MSKHLVLVGGGHAHMTVLRNMSRITGKGHRVTLVSPDAYHYYSGMGPGMLGGFYRPQDIRFNIRAMAERGWAAFLEGRVVRIDARRRRLLVATPTGEREIGYDVASFNIGSSVAGPPMCGAGSDVFPVKPIIGLWHARQRLLSLSEERGRVRVVVSGGGPAGFEIALNARAALGGARGEVTIVAGHGLLPGLPDRARRLARFALGRQGVSLLEGQRVRSMGDHVASLDNGRRLPFDLAFLAGGVVPPSLFRESGLPTGPSGGLLVDAFLRCPAAPELFGGGDCIDFGPRALDKVGVFAVRENLPLYGNLAASLDDGELSPFRPGGPYLLVYNCGDGTGLFVRGRIMFDGRLAFVLKDAIDRKFMRRFQMSGERFESL